MKLVRVLDAAEAGFDGFLIVRSVDERECRERAARREVRSKGRDS
jgi:hypothetical protein